MRGCVHGVVLAILTAVAVTIVPDRADAQFTDSLGGHWNNPGSALLGTMIANRMLLKAARKADPPDNAAPSRPAAPAAPVRTTFRPVATSLMARELAQSMGSDETTRRDLLRLFDYYLQTFDEQTRKDHEDPYDVGRAAAYFVMTNYAVVAGREPSDQQADGAQKKFRAGLAENPDFARMSDRDRQRLYETLVILGSLPVTGLTDARQKKDEGRQQMFRDFARQNIETLLGVPAEKIRLTQTGFIIEP